jgi:iron complex transport system substrate-binding protein
LCDVLQVAHSLYCLGRAKVENIGAAIIECADYMETSALGRAEWMRFYGMLTGKENTADSLFAAIEHNYKTIVNENNKQKKHPKVLTERVTNGVWYCPGGNSSMAKLIKDAGGKYIFADNNQSGSLNLSPEMVINKSTDADVWLFIYYGNRPLTRNELAAEYSGYKTIKAFKEGNIYECNGKTSTYFEEISFRPDFLLEELTHILYSPDSTLRYYKRISE